MRTLLPLAALLLAGCATGRGRSGDLPESDRGFATDNSLDCARLVLEQRAYRVESLRGTLRAGKAFAAREGNMIVQGFVTARLEPSDDGRAVLRVLTDRRVSGGAGRRETGGRLYPSALLEANEVLDDATAVLRECTTGPASNGS